MLVCTEMNAHIHQGGQELASPKTPPLSVDLLLLVIIPPEYIKVGNTPTAHQRDMVHVMVFQPADDLTAPAIRGPSRLPSPAPTVRFLEGSAHIRLYII